MKKRTLFENIQQALTQAFEDAGCDGIWSKLTPSKRPDLADYQCNGAMSAAKDASEPPRALADSIIAKLASGNIIGEATVAGPGFINIRVSDAALASWANEMLEDARLGCPQKELPESVVIDFGGPNVAKPMHVGHLRSLIIGDCLQRLFRFVGDRVVSDVHLGDWGLPVGMLIIGIQEKFPDLPFFQTGALDAYPEEVPLTLNDLEVLYPAMAERCRADEELRTRVRLATAALQGGNQGYRALWKCLMAISIESLKVDFARLSVKFDLWDGESTINDRIPALVERLSRDGMVEDSQGAKVISVARDSYNPDLPPLILVKSDGGYTYGTTDLATIDHRIDAFKPDKILYVVDKRQGTHFLQVFRAANRTGIAKDLELEHIGFGTVNGPNGTPLKTREGGVMRLSGLLDMAKEIALLKIGEAELSLNLTSEERDSVAELIGIATVKFADLSNHRLSDYAFDLERFTSFEGKTGAYLQYTVVRMRSLLRKAQETSSVFAPIAEPQHPTERALLLLLGGLPESIYEAYNGRTPHVLCDFAHSLAQCFSRFYVNCHVLSEKDLALRASRLSLVRLTLRQLEFILALLGIEAPDQM